MSKPCILIATPTPGMVKTRYMRTVIGTIRDLARREIASDFDTVEGSDLAAARNMLATRFLERAEFTHLFFVDSDMAFPHDLCARLLATKKPVVGAAYPRRELSLAKVEQALRAGLPLERALLAGAGWNAQFIGGNPDTPLARVGAIGFGTVLIERAALEAMIAKGAARLQPTVHHGERRYNFFGCREEDAARGDHPQEDVSFCYRWTKDCGGEIWALLDAPVLHIGDFSYGGALWELLSSDRPASQRGSTAI